MNTIFENRILLYMDILGSKNIILSQSDHTLVIKELIDQFSNLQQEYKEETINPEPRQCYLAFTVTFNESEIFALEITNAAAYIRSEGKLYYSIPHLKKIDEIPLSAQELQAFDDKFNTGSIAPTAPRLLSLTDLDNIKLITKHEHSIGIKSLTKIYPTISNFSDHLIASVPYPSTETEFVFNIANLISYASWLHLLALEKGMLMRGAITAGDLFHRGNSIIGKALIEAVDIEENVASYPRVIISENLINIIPPHLRLFIEQDFDGLFFINYLRDSRYVKGDLYVKIQQIINNKLADIKLMADIRRAMKWQWLAKKFIIKQ
ncbi:TPA: hypothetical protein ACM2VO_003358 [Legionella pneumophila]